MTRSFRVARRGAVLLAGAAATALLVSGCGTGQIAETANVRPGIPGVNVETENGLFKIRNLAVEYLDPLGYPAGSTAPLGVALYNDSNGPVTVEISTDSAEAVVLVEPGATPTPTPGGSPAATPDDPTGAPPVDGASPTPGDEASPTAGATPGTDPTPDGTSDPAGRPGPSTSPGAPVLPEPPAGGPARIDIPAGGFVLLYQDGGRYLQLVGLDSGLRPGQSVNLTFDFGGETIETPVPVAVPLDPAPRGSAEGEEAGGGHG